jgi:hypothetical protein
MRITVSEPECESSHGETDESNFEGKDHSESDQSTKSHIGTIDVEMDMNADSDVESQQDSHHLI